MPDQPTKAEQDYLKAIHRLGGADQQASPTDIAAQSWRPCSLCHRNVETSCRGRLDRLRTRPRSSSHGARHRGSGPLIRRHRLVELLLTRVLGLDWSEVDAEAEALEHAVSPRVEQALAAFLGEPLEDPHGHPIPTREGLLEQRKLRPLCDFQPGDRVVIREAQDDKPERLRRCANLVSYRAPWFTSSVINLWTTRFKSK